MTAPRPRIPTASPSGTAAVEVALRARWERLHWQIRCALPPLEPARIRLYVHLGIKIGRRGGPPVGVHRRMLANLLAVGHDEALPWAWRSACLEHLNLPLALLTSLIGPRDPEAVQAMLDEVESARDALPASPGAGVRDGV